MRKAIIAMSGGVDSSVAALLTKETGDECIGATMKLFHNEDIGVKREKTCCSLDDVEDARNVCYRMGIRYYVFNFSERFKEDVMDRFVDAYEHGATPNPCIDCNRYLKFDKMFQRMRELEYDYIVTGHYARVEYDEEKNRYLLKKAVDDTKDQSYVLYMLTQEQLAHISLPLGGLRKTEVREIAEKHGFVNARKHDSQDICFVRTAITPASWRTSPASITRQAIFWTRTAKRWAPTTVRCGIPSASARALALPWVRRCMSAPRICRPTPSRWARRRTCLTASSMPTR